MATQYGAATGNYSRQSILDARKSGGTAGTRIVKDASQARPGDYVWGSVTPVGGNAVPGTQMKGSTGYSGSKTGANGATLVDFDTQGMYDASLKSKNALLKQNYNTMMNTLTNNYNANKAQYDIQGQQINDNYTDSVDQIHQQTYDSNEANKVLSANRGIMNSQQGLAARQGVIREGNDNVNQATKQRNQMLNELQSKIAQLTQAYGNDKMTAETNYGLGQTQVLNEALLSKMQADMDIAKTNAGYENQWGLQNDQQAWQEMQNNLDRQQQMAIAQLNASTQLKAAGISAGAQRYAAKLARQDRKAAQDFIEKQYADEQAAKAASETQALYEKNAYWNPNAKVGIWDKMLPWDTKNEKAVSLMKQYMDSTSASSAAKNAYIEGMYKKYPGIIDYSYNPNWMDDFNYKK